jgi:hypothetical protein
LLIWQKELFNHSQPEAALGITNKMDVVSSDTPPYGPIFLTFFYVTFGLMVRLVFVGNDGSFGIIQWSTSFFLAGMTSILALHLGIYASSSLGLLAFAVLSTGFVFEGCSYLLLDNTTGVSDRRHNNSILFYLFNIVKYTLWTMSAVILGRIFRKAWNDLNYQSISTKLSRVGSATLMLSLVSLITASILSIFSVSSDVDGNMMDEVSNKSEYQSEITLRYFRILEWIWYGLLFLFLVVTACELRPLIHAITHEAVIFVWGLSSKWAADGVILSLFGSLVFAIFIILESAGTIQTRSSAMIFILLTFNYFVLMTFFYLHNLVFALSHLDFEDDDSKNDETKIGIHEENKAGDTDEGSTTDDGGTTTIVGRGGAEVVYYVEQAPQYDLQQRSMTPECDREALPTSQSGAIKKQALWRMASGRRPEITRIRSSRVEMKNEDSQSSNSSSSSSSFSYDDDDRTNDFSRTDSRSYDSA